MSMMDTSTKFESRIRMKKLIIYKCEQCPKMVFHYGYGIYCGGIDIHNKNKNKIIDSREIPDWCPLKDEK